MTIQEAINLVDQVIQQYRGTRREHAILAEALEVLKKNIKTSSSKKEDSSN